MRSDAVLFLLVSAFALKCEGIWTADLPIRPHCFERRSNCTAFVESSFCFISLVTRKVISSARHFCARRYVSEWVRFFFGTLDLLQCRCYYVKFEPLRSDRWKNSNQPCVKLSFVVGWLSLSDGCISKFKEF